MPRSRDGVFINVVQFTLFVKRCYSNISNDTDVATHRNMDDNDDNSNIINFVPISNIRVQLHSKTKPK